METYAPQIEIAEEIPRFDLLEELADQQLTVGKYTMALRDLADKCPIDLSDPKVTMEMKNDFVVKMVNKAGIAIDPKYEQHFTETIERKGLERKFTIASKNDNPTEKHIEETDPKIAQESDSVTDTPRAFVADKTAITKSTVALHRVDIPHPKLEIRHEQREVTTVNIVGENAIANVIDLEAVLQARHIDALLRQDLTPSHEVLKLGAPQQLRALDAADGFVGTYTDENQQKDRLRTDEAVTVNDADIAEVISAFMFELEITNAALELPMFLAPHETATMVDHSIDSQNDIVETSGSTATIDALAAELDKQPVEIYEDFIAVTEKYMQIYIDEQQVLEDYTLEAEPTGQANASLLVVLERMQSVDEATKAEAAETVQQLIGAVHGLAILESRPDTPVELTEQVAAQVVAICENLLKELDLELSEDDIQSLVYLFQQSKFLTGFIVQEAEQAIDTGMHEMLDDKSASISSYLSGIHPSRLLSRFILTLPVAA